MADSPFLFIRPERHAFDRSRRRGDEPHQAAPDRRISAVDRGGPGQNAFTRAW